MLNEVHMCSHYARTVLLAATVALAPLVTTAASAQSHDVDPKVVPPSQAWEAPAPTIDVRRVLAQVRDGSFAISDAAAVSPATLAQAGPNGTSHKAVLGAVGAVCDFFVGSLFWGVVRLDADHTGLFNLGAFIGAGIGGLMGALRG
jgi:hypothetical protein